MNPTAEEVVMSIVYTPATDQLRVSGPLGNRVLCYGMLGAARDVVAAGSTVSKTPLLIPRFVPRMPGQDNGAGKGT